MKLVLRNYLCSLKEDGELDRICVEILKDYGLTVISTPQIGTRQYGVDVLARGRLSVSGQDRAYALIIKCKDIDRVEYEREKTGIRASIQECLEVYVQNHLPPECRDIPLIVCIVCGGEIKFEVRENLNSLYTREREIAQRNGLNVTFEEWNGAKLSEMMLASMDNTNVVVRGSQRLLFRALALAAEPDMSFSAFKAFVDKVLKMAATATSADRRKHLNSIVLAVAMLMNECDKDEVNNRDASWRAAEYAYLRLWECEKRASVVIDDISRLYCTVANQYLSRIEGYVSRRYGFTLSVQGNNEVDVILRFYDVLGRLASYGLYLRSQNRDVDIRRRILVTMEQMLVGNFATVMPLSDSHAGPIGMSMLFLKKEGLDKVAEDWLEMLVQNIGNAFHQGYAYPVTNLNYAQLIEHLHSNERSKDIAACFYASELMPILLVMAKVLHREDISSNIIQLVGALPRNTDYQVWYLDGASEGSFYQGDRLCGSQLCSLPLGDVDRTCDMILKESALLPVELSCTKVQHAGLLFIGCRHYDFPLPGNFWANEIRDKN